MTFTLAMNWAVFYGALAMLSGVASIGTGIGGIAALENRSGRAPGRFLVALAFGALTALLAGLASA